ncbi:xanthine dehydrogenase family protein molybdopterin-binding subunit [Noviherbaspirillum humi]|nr:molybdopterin cofactor-binding domain-containing protein [Noviherbaspirillum humi]
MQKQNDAAGISFSRRQFFKTTGALVVSVSMPWAAASAFAQAAAAAGSAGKPALTPDQLDSWVAILPNGDVEAYFGKVDLGQGLEVAIAQIVAEELDVPVDRVEVVMGDSATSCNQGGASSALGIQAGAKPLRNASAEARRLLLEMASKRLDTPVERLTVADGVVSVAGNPAKRVSYADLIGGKYFHSQVEWNKKIGNPLEITAKAKPKSPAEYKVVGQPIPRRDVEWAVFGADPKASGEKSFVTDVSLPNMLHARVIRTPRAGCVPVKVDEASIAGIRGARVIREKNFLAVVAEREWDAVKAAQMLKVDWSEAKKPFPTMDKLHDHIRNAPVVKREDEVKRGDVPAAFKNAAKIVEAEFMWPFQSHASMGPACAVADVKADSAVVWTGTQKPHYARDGVAALLGMPAEKVRAIWVKGPGSYGRNDAGDAVLEAAYLSKLTGRPVRLQGMRVNGTAWDPKAPASVHRCRAALDASGKVIGYDFITKAFSRANIETNESDPSDSLLGMELGLPLKPGAHFGTPLESYGFENKRLGWEVIPPLLDRASPLRTSHMRDPIGPQIQFASEQFIDELALATNEDPVAFRLKYLTAPRDKAVVRAAADRAGWQPRVGPNPDRSGDLLKGRGIAYAQRGGSILAIVSEVEVERKTGRIWGRRFTVAHDCGLIINPQGLRATIEGGLVQALSRSLFEEVQFDENMVTSVDWNTYPILEAKDAPETIDIVLLNHPKAPPTGAGEATCRIVAASVANAFFDATGVRLRQAPMTPQRVLAALKA